MIKWKPDKEKLQEEASHRKGMDAWKAKPILAAHTSRKRNAEVLQLFYDTVRKINSRDYTSEQISAWVLSIHEK